MNVMSMQLTCPSCGTSIDADDVNLDALIAKCAACDAVFNFGDSVGATTTARRREPVEQPKGITVRELPDAFEIERKWFGPSAFGLLIFVILWDGFLVFWYSMALGGGMKGGNGIEWGAVLFPLIHVAVGLGMTYFCIASFINKTLIRVTVNELTVKHGPIPTFGNKTLMTLNVAQIYCKKKVTRTKNGTSISYQVRAKQTNDKDVKLVTGLRKSAQALFIEQQMERVMGLEDRAVDGEMRR